MYRKKNLKFGLSLMLGVLSFLNSCAATNSEPMLCPTYPIAGPKVATELEKIEFDTAPNFWEWLARINKLKSELEVCKILTQNQTN